MNILALFNFKNSTIQLNEEKDIIQKEYINIVLNNFIIDNYQLPTVIYGNDDMLWYYNSKTLHRENEKPAAIYLKQKQCVWAIHGKFYLPNFLPSATLILKSCDPLQEEAMNTLGRYYLKKFDIKSIKRTLTELRQEIYKHKGEEMFFLNKHIEKIIKKIASYGL